MSQSMEMAVRIDKTVSQIQYRYLQVRYNCVTVNRDRLRRDITVSQSLEKALGETLQCHIR